MDELSRGPEKEDGAQRVDWPYASLLLFGFFGTDTPAGRRLARRTSFGLVLFLVAIVGLRDGGAGLVPRTVWAGALPVATAGIGLAYARYLAELDELSRMIQLKALAFSYGVAMTLAFALAGLAASTRSPGHPAFYLTALVIVEGLRGLALVVLARRYR